MTSETCKMRVSANYRARLADLRRLWAAYCEGEEDVEDLGNIFEYGLCFDYVAPHTFNGQRAGYFRYQLSTGGPGDEFRFYVNLDYEPYNIEYWLLDWFDGARVRVSLDHKPGQFLSELFTSFFVESEAAKSAYEQAVEE